MVFQPQNYKKADGVVNLDEKVTAAAHPCLNTAIAKELWHSFSLSSSEIDFAETDAPTLVIGDAEPLPLDGYAYSINVTTEGICVIAENEKELLNGYMTLLDRFKAIDKDEQPAIEIECCQIRDRAEIQNRMVHFCIFPETELWELQRFVRFCGALKYTHIVLEFWGMLQYDCLKELSWSHAFTKEQIRPIICEANDLGLEVIPMFNHWGHASAGRVMHGKHVVLDQNPRLQTYFGEDGWCWDIKKPKVRALFRHIREELCELCGEGKYFHVGCDEAYGFDFSKESMDQICDFLNEISRDMNEKGRRIIAWGDMCLSKHPEFNPENRYADCNNPSLEAEQYMLAHLDRSIVIADWQYQAPVAPVETSAIFQNAGFDCLLCPWDRGMAQTNAAISTAKEYGLMGFMHTTWHTLSGGIPYVTLTAIGGFESIDARKMISLRLTTAALLRKVMPIGGDYAKAGWSKFQVSCKW